MEIFRNLNTLKERIVNLVNLQNIHVISIDGRNGSGKSTLAKSLCDEENYFHLELDDDSYLIKEQSTYLKHIKYGNLEKEIKINLNSNKVIVVDGICVLKIIDRIHVNSELKIYIKRLSSYGYWYDNNDFDYTRDVEDILRENEKSLKSFIQLKAKAENKTTVQYKYKESFFHEIIRYHHDYKPDENSDIIFERIQNST